MKRLAWLLLALSLPAQATINGVDSSRVVFPSFDGTRYGQYVAGDFPETPPGYIWSQDFESLSTSQVFTENAVVYGTSNSLEASAGLGYIADCYSGITVSTAQARAGTKSLKFYNDISVAGDQTACSAAATKARVETSLGANAYKMAKNKMVGAGGGTPNGEGFTFGTERWFGYSMYFPTAGNGGWSSGNSPIIFQIFGNAAPTGDCCSPILHFQLGAGGQLLVNTEFSAEAGDLTSAQDYLYTAGKVRWPDNTAITLAGWNALKSSGGAGYHLKNLAGTSSLLTRDTWHDVVIHFKKGYTKATGLIEIWLDGTKIVDLPAFPTTQNDFVESFVKTGIYSGKKTASDQYTMYVDSWRAYDEQGTFNAVDPAQDD